MSELSDELLVAYVDGQLAKNQARAVEKVLKDDEVVARRAQALQEAHERLEFAFDSILAGELKELVPVSLAPPAEEPPLQTEVEERWSEPEQASSGFPKSALAGVGLACGLVGGALGYFAMPAPEAPPAPPPQIVEVPLPPPPPPTPTWQEDTARAHALVSRESLEVSLESQGNPYLLAFQLTKEIGQSVRGPDLRPEGYRFVRAQVLRYGDKPMAQMLYLPKTGEPLALYAMPGGEDSDPKFLQEGAVGAVSWTQEDVSYLLAAEVPEDVLMRMAEKIRNAPRPELETSAPDAAAAAAEEGTQAAATQSASPASDAAAQESPAEESPAEDSVAEDSVAEETAPEAASPETPAAQPGDDAADESPAVEEPAGEPAPDATDEQPAAPEASSEELQPAASDTGAETSAEPAADESGADAGADETTPPMPERTPDSEAADDATDEAPAAETVPAE